MTSSSTYVLLVDGLNLGKGVYISDDVDEFAVHVARTIDKMGVGAKLEVRRVDNSNIEVNEDPGWDGEVCKHCGGDIVEDEAGRWLAANPNRMGTLQQMNPLHCYNNGATGASMPHQPDA